MAKQKFKVGDKVVIRGQKGKYERYNGEKGTVMSVYSTGERCRYTVDLKNEIVEASAHDLDLTEEKMETLPKFNVGDKVVHPTFGEGIVQERWVHPGLNSVRYIVSFPNTGSIECPGNQLTKSTLQDEITLVSKNDHTVTITLEQAKNYYEQGGELRNIALQAFTEDELKPKPKFPRTWDEYCNDFYPHEKHMHYTPNFVQGFRGDDCDAFIAYGKLIRLRRAWIRDWKPDWNGTKCHYCIVVFNNKYIVDNFLHTHHALSFPTQEMANDFLNCFRDLLEQAKGLC